MMHDLSAAYPVWFCDVWGVVHDGLAPNPATVSGLARHRANGGMVVLLTNSPRSAAGVARQLDEIGVPRSAWDGIVTSGDVTRSLMLAVPGGRLHHIGPQRDLSLFAGLAVTRVPLAQASAVVCTGLFHDDRETPDDYAGTLTAMRARDLTMICANPDLVVRRGPHLIPCAGGIAQAYAERGGRVEMAGKPFAPIYDLALREAARLRGTAVVKAQVLAIGDGPDTDVKGAADQGLPVVLVADGVTDASAGLDAVAAAVAARQPHARILRTVHDLAWD